MNEAGHPNPNDESENVGGEIDHYFDYVAARSWAWWLGVDVDTWARGGGARGAREALYVDNPYDVMAVDPELVILTTFDDDDVDLNLNPSDDDDETKPYFMALMAFMASIYHFIFIVITWIYWICIWKEKRKKEQVENIRSSFSRSVFFSRQLSPTPAPPLDFQLLFSSFSNRWN